MIGIKVVLMNPIAKSQLAPSGVLKVAIFTGNYLLVTGSDANGTPQGVSPDLAHALASSLGVPASLSSYANQVEAVDSVVAGVNDIVLIGSDPVRAQKIDFSPAYVEIEATYLVPADSSFQDIAEVDSSGVRISVWGVSAYGLALERIIKNAHIVKAKDEAEAFNTFVEAHLEALAGLRSGLLKEQLSIPGSRVLDGKFAEIQQAIGIAKGKPEALLYLHNFIELSKASGFISDLIAKHQVVGLSIAPPVDQ